MLCASCDLEVGGFPDQKSCNLPPSLALSAFAGGRSPNMAQHSIDKDKLIREKRELARRARRLAQTQPLEADRERLTQFAAALDAQAEPLAQAISTVSLPPVAAPQPQVRQQQVQQQQQSAEQPKTQKHTD